MKRRNKLSKKKKHHVPISFVEAKRLWWDEFIYHFPIHKHFWYMVNEDLKGTDRWWERLSNLQEKL